MAPTESERPPPRDTGRDLSRDCVVLPARPAVRRADPVKLVAEAAKMARSPLERLRWLGQVQGHPDSTPEDVSTAVAVARFVHSRHGATFCGHNVLARILRIKPRQLQNRLLRLKQRGHIAITRQSRGPSKISATLLPDCVPDMQPDCTSSDDFDVQSECTSKQRSDVQQRCTSEIAPRCATPLHVRSASDVQPQRIPMCNGLKIDGLKSDSYESLNKGRTWEFASGVEFSEPKRPALRANASPDFSAEFIGPANSDELLFDTLDVCEDAPPFDPVGLDKIASEEATKPEPPGWREFVNEQFDDARPKARRRRVAGDFPDDTSAAEFRT